MSLMTRSKRFCFATVLCVTLMSSFSSSSVAMTSTSSDVHNWLFDTSGSTAVNTQSEAVTVANRYDVVVAALAYKPFLSAMKTANPGILIAPYHKGTSVQDADFTWMKSNHPTWLLHTAGGSLLKSSWGTYLIDPGSSGVRTWMADYAKTLPAQGWNAVFLDSMGLYGFTGFTGDPINPRTGKAYTTTQWITDTKGLAAAVGSAVSIPVIANGLRTGPGYWSDTKPLVGGIQAGEFEGCFRDATSRISAFPSESNWLAMVNALQDVQAQGRAAMCWTKTWTSATSSQIKQWHDFALGSFLLAQGGSEYFFFSGHKTDNALSWYGDDGVKLGNPTSGITTSSGVYLRHFSGGVVAVNPTSSAQGVSLGSTYTLPSGARAAQATVPAHSGLILTG
jgi:hypothetical protein